MEVFQDGEGVKLKNKEGRHKIIIRISNKAMKNLIKPRMGSRPIQQQETDALYRKPSYLHSASEFMAFGVKPATTAFLN